MSTFAGRLPTAPGGARAGLLVVLAAAGALALAGGAAAAAAPAAGSCPSSNPPNELTLAGGTPQTAKLDSQYGSPFQVALANTNGCPVTTAVAGTLVTFAAPTSGPSGLFGASGSSSITAGTDASGSAAATMFTANDLPGSYTLTASSSYGSVSFALTNTAAGVAVTITAEPPPSQAATVGDHYAAPLAVQVLDANGNPVADAQVTFSLGGGGGAGGGAGASAGGVFDGGQAQATATTNSAGIATSPLFSADGAAGAFTATASTAGVTEPAAFKLDNLAGRLSIVGSPDRVGRVDSPYARPLQVVVRDSLGAPVAGATVTFTLGSAGAGGAGGGGAGSAGASFLDGGTSATETTGPGGRATSPRFSANGTAGSFTATAALAGVLNPLAFTLDNLAGKPPRIVPLVGSGRSATTDSRYARPLEVRVLDAGGTPDQGATVTFSLGGGAGAGAGAGASAGATFLDGSAQATATTDASGLAVSPLFTANGTAGTFTASASVAGVTNPATITLANRAGKPPIVTPVAGASRSATVAARYARPLEVRVRAADGTPDEGVAVTFALGGGGGASGGAGGSTPGASFLGGSAQATETTDAGGLAVSPLLSANATPGVFTATASVQGVTNPVSFSLDNLAARPPSIRPSRSDPESAVVDARFPSPLAVTVRGPGGAPLQGTTVTFTLGSAAGGGAGGASGSAGASFVGGSNEATETTNAAGRAVSPAFDANAVAGTFTATAAVSQTTVVASFQLRNRAGAPTALKAGAAASEQTAVGTRFPIALAVTVTDKENNAVAGALVTFTAPAAGASGRFRGGARVVRVRTNATGIAVAPPFEANGTPGGYIVRAAAKGGAAAAFALVNTAPGQGA